MSGTGGGLLIVNVMRKVFLLLIVAYRIVDYVQKGLAIVFLTVVFLNILVVNIYPNLIMFLKHSWRRRCCYLGVRLIVA